MSCESCSLIQEAERGCLGSDVSTSAPAPGSASAAADPPSANISPNIMHGLFRFSGKTLHNYDNDTSVCQKFAHMTDLCHPRPVEQIDDHADQDLCLCIVSIFNQNAAPLPYMQ